MKITAASLPRPQVLPRTGLTTRAPDFLVLMKPRVMLLAVFTAFAGMMIAPASLDPLFGSLAMMAIAAGAGAAGVLNMWYEADIDAVMTRTARRPIPRGRISRREALAFGLSLCCGAVLVLVRPQVAGVQGDEEIADIMGKVYKVRPFGLTAANMRELNPTGK